MSSCDDRPSPLEEAIAKEKARQDREAAAKKKAEEEWEKYGEHLDTVNSLKKKLEREPCDRPKAVELGNILYRAGAYREAAERTQAFIKKCGDFSRLRWVSYESYKAISEWDKAEAEASKLIEEDRNDKDFWWWRGFVREKKKDYEGAVADYRQALSLVPQLNAIPFNLADVYEKMGKPCEAIFPLEQFLHYHPEVRGADRVRRRINSLYAKPTCNELAGTGRAVTLRVPKSGGVISTRAKINGKSTKLIVDTGASYVALRKEKAESWGIALDGKPKVLLKTANGIVSGEMVVLDEVAVGKLKARRVPAVVMETLAPGFDGLLGMSFLSRYTVELNQGRGRMKIKKR